LVEIIGNTVFFIRRENSPTELIKDVRGYGHSFPEAYTTWDAEVKGSESHQRILRYSFSGLDCLIRFEADGYLETEVQTLESKATKKSSTFQDSSDLATIFDNTSFRGQTGVSLSNAPLAITENGALIPRTALVDIKTRSIRKKDSESDTFATQISRLWLRQIPYLILSYHEYGSFSPSNITIHDLSHRHKDWEDQNQAALKRFAKLLHKIMAFGYRRLDNKFEIVYLGEEGVLELREQDEGAGNVLPDDMVTQWKEGGNEKSGRQELKPDENGKGILANDSESSQPLKYDGLEEENHHHLNNDLGSSDESEDFTECSVKCGYCGHCRQR
jgi:hypothetical protein